MSPTVSVLIAAYNAQQTIARAIESALAQVECNIEIIVVDDCSVDKTYDIALSYAKHDERVTVLKTRNNAGPSTARNVAIKSASGQWLSVLDADDYFAPNRLITLLRAAQCDNLDIVVDSYFLCQPNDSGSCDSRFTNLCEQGKGFWLTAPNFIKLGLGSTKPLFKRSLLSNGSLAFNETVKSGEDLLLYSQILLRKPNCKFLNQPTYFRTEHGDSLSRRDRVSFLNELIRIFELLKLSMASADYLDENVLSAINYRQKVNEDALVAARWRWLMMNRKLPSFFEVLDLYKLFRHVWCKKMRFSYSGRR